MTWLAVERPGKRERATAADGHAAGANAPTLANSLGAEDRDRHDRRTGLELEPADAALGLAERPGPDPGALGEDPDHAAPLEDQASGLHRLLVRLAAPDRECAER